MFVGEYERFARTGAVSEAAGYGLFLACVAGVIVDLNQHVLLAIPGLLACVWFLGGLAGFTLYGLIMWSVDPPVPRKGPEGALGAE